MGSLRSRYDHMIALPFPTDGWCTGYELPGFIRSVIDIDKGSDEFLGSEVSTRRFRSIDPEMDQVFGRIQYSEDGVFVIEQGRIRSIAGRLLEALGRVYRSSAFSGRIFKKLKPDTIVGLDRVQPGIFQRRRKRGQWGNRDK